MNVDREILEYESAGALAEELPYWGWLEDGRSCLTRSGELVSIGRLSPVVLDGRTPDQLDRVLERWQRMLSGVDSRTRLYFYLFRRPTRFEDADADRSFPPQARAFLAERVRDVDIYSAWSYDPRLEGTRGQTLVDVPCPQLEAGGGMRVGLSLLVRAAAEIWSIRPGLVA